MKSSVGWALILAAVSALAVAGWFRGPREVEKIVPRITTVHDTVTLEHFDTTWIEKVREVVRVDTVNLVERVTVTVPETVTVVPRIACATSLDAPPTWGDSLVIGGLRIEPQDNEYLLSKWRAQYFSTGPLRSLIVDSVPPAVSFWPRPEPSGGCGFFCTLKHYLVGGAGGYALCRLGQLGQ